jgi:hypothetical protein
MSGTHTPLSGSETSNDTPITNIDEMGRSLVETLTQQQIMNLTQNPTNQTNMVAEETIVFSNSEGSDETPQGETEESRLDDTVLATRQQLMIDIKDYDTLGRSTPKNDEKESSNVADEAMLEIKEQDLFEGVPRQGALYPTGGVEEQKDDITAETQNPFEFKKGGFENSSSDDDSSGDDFDSDSPSTGSTSSDDDKGKTRQKWVKEKVKTGKIEEVMTQEEDDDKIEKVTNELIKKFFSVTTRATVDEEIKDQKRYVNDIVEKTKSDATRGKKYNTLFNKPRKPEITEAEITAIMEVVDKSIITKESRQSMADILLAVNKLVAIRCMTPKRCHRDLTNVITNSMLALNVDDILVIVEKFTSVDNRTMTMIAEKIIDTLVKNNVIAEDDKPEIQRNNVITIDNLSSGIIAVDGKTYGNNALVTIMSKRTITGVTKTNEWLEQVIKNNHTIVLDRANMNKSMGMTMEQINEFAEVLTSYGVTTIDFYEAGDVISSATLNVLVNPNEHDDTVALIYAACRNGIIITNDTHKEFAENMKYCHKHNQCILRKHDICSRSGDGDCRVSIMNMYKPKYTSFERICTKNNILTMNIKTPMIRNKNERAMKTKTIQFKPSTGANKMAKWSVEMNKTNTPLAITTYMTGIEKFNHTSMTVAGEASTKVYTFRNTTAGIVAITNVMEDADLKEFADKATTEMVNIHGVIMLKQTGAKPVEFESKNYESILRNNAVTGIVSKPYKFTKTISKTQLRMPSDNINVKIHNDTEMTITSKLLAHSLCIMRQQNNYYIIKLSPDVVDAIEAESFKKILQKDKDDDTLYPITMKTLANNMRVITAEQLQRQMETQQESMDEIINISNVTRNLECGSMLTQVVADIDKVDWAETLILANVSTRSSPMKPNIETDKDGQFRMTKTTYAMASVYDKRFNEMDGDTARIQITMQNNEQRALSLFRLHNSDFERIKADIFYCVNASYKSVITDVSTIFKYVISEQMMPWLPPLLTAYTTNRYSVRDGVEPMRIELTWNTPGCTITGKIFIPKKGMKAFITTNITPGLTFIYSTVSLINNNQYNYNFIPPDSMYDEIQHIVECAMIAGLYDIIVPLMAYATAFALPLALCGYPVIETLCKFKPMLTDNIVTGLIQNPEPEFSMATDMHAEVEVYVGDFVYALVNNDMTMTLKRKSNGMIIDIAAEVHEMISTLSSISRNRDAKTMVNALMFIAPIINERVIIDHLNKCYNARISTADSNIYHTEMYQFFVDTEFLRRNHVCHFKDTDIDVSRSVQKVDTKYDRPYKTINENLMLYRENETIVRLERRSKIEVQTVINKIPVRGDFNLIVITCKQTQDNKDMRRSKDVLEYLVNRERMTLKRRNVVVGLKLEKWNAVLSHIKSTLELNKPLIIIAEDKIPSLMKIFNKNIEVGNLADVKPGMLIIPDTQMYITCKNRLKEIAMTDQNQQNVETGKQGQSKLDATTTQEPALYAGFTPQQWIFGLIALAILLVCLYFGWPYVMRTLTWPYSFVSSKAGAVVGSTVTKTWLQTLFLLQGTVVPTVSLPLWAKLLGGAVTAMWWSILGGTAGVLGTMLYKQP